MDGSKPEPSRYSPPGAPELGKSVKIPSAPPAPDTGRKGPVFQPSSAAATGNQTAVQTPKQPATAPVDEHQARLEYLRSLRDGRPKKSHKVRNTLLIILLVLVVFGGGAGAAWYWQQHKQPAAKPKQSTAQRSQPQSTTSQDTTDSNSTFSKQTKEYDASDFGLTLQYPSDWTPAEQNGVLTISSPNTTLTDATGAQVTGQVVLTVRSKQDNPEEFAKGNAVAVLASDKVNYTHPTSTQRGSTYISYLQYAATTTKGGLDGVYITGDNGYQYAQNIPKSDIAGVDPLVDVTFVKCSDDACAKGSQTPLTISGKSWTGDLKDTVETMFKSFTFN